MSLKLKCTGKDQNEVHTFVCTGVAYEGREFTFAVPFAELEAWSKKATTMIEMMDAPFNTGPGIFDHPIASFALYSMVMSLGGNEELVGAELSLTANKKVTP